MNKYIIKLEDLLNDSPEFSLARVISKTENKALKGYVDLETNNVKYKVHDYNNLISYECNDINDAISKYNGI